MFFVVNKRKINSYLISLGTVIVLFAVSLLATKNMNNTVQTSGAITEYPILKVETTQKNIAMSINCSENEENIDSILEILSKTKSKASFFVTGEFAEKYPDTVKKIASSGNEIASLSNTYCHLKNKNEQDVIKEIDEASKKIESITENKIKLFRAPYGEYNSLVVEQVKKHNLTMIQWNIDALDYNGLNGDEMWERIKESLSNGSIILMHNNAKHTAESLEKIIKNIQEKGYEVTTVSQLLVI